MERNEKSFQFAHLLEAYLHRNRHNINDEKEMNVKYNSKKEKPKTMKDMTLQTKVK